MNIFSYNQFFEWNKQLKEGKEEIENYPYPACPSTSKIEENIEKIGIDWVTVWPEGQILNNEYYLGIPTVFRDGERTKGPEWWKDKLWIRYQDDALDHDALIKKSLLAKHGIPMLENPPYSPDLAPFGLFYVPKNQGRIERIEVGDS